jgi:hypothetical protein
MGSSRPPSRNTVPLAAPTLLSYLSLQRKICPTMYFPFFYSERDASHPEILFCNTQSWFLPPLRRLWGKPGSNLELLRGSLVSASGLNHWATTSPNHWATTSPSELPHPHWATTSPINYHIPPELLHPQLSYRILTELPHPHWSTTSPTELPHPHWGTTSPLRYHIYVHWATTSP